MSRPTDQARGARIALSIAEPSAKQYAFLYDEKDDFLPLHFWQAIVDAANEVLEEEAALRLALKA